MNGVLQLLLLPDERIETQLKKIRGNAKVRGSFQIGH